MRPEHVKYATREEWELVVFDNATIFRVSRFLGRGQWDTKDFKTFPGAMKNAARDPQAMVSAVCDSGRWIRCDRSEWPSFGKRWQERKRRMNK